ncbi:hypothetical protein D918_09234 [Trichuris suis]|nr:hypothetical protein D918_09234 [Trichuris suis]
MPHLLPSMIQLTIVLAAVISMQISGYEAFQSYNGRDKPARIKALKYKDCGGPDSTVRVDHLEAEPHPLEVPGLLRLTLRVNVSAPPPDEVYVKLFLRKRIADARWVRIPCIFGFGSW